MNYQSSDRVERYLHRQSPTAYISPRNPDHDLRLDHHPASDRRAKSHRSLPSLDNPHSSASPSPLTPLPRLVLNIGENRIGFWHLLERLALHNVAQAKAQAIQDHR